MKKRYSAWSLGAEELRSAQLVLISRKPSSHNTAGNIPNPKTEQRHDLEAGVALIWQGRVRTSEDDFAPVQVVERGEQVNVFHEDAG